MRLMLLVACLFLTAGCFRPHYMVTIHTPYGVYKDVSAKWTAGGIAEFWIHKPNAKHPTRIVTSQFLIEIDKVKR